MTMEIWQGYKSEVNATRKRNYRQAGLIFQRAVNEYNEGHIYNALQTARYALKVARRTGAYWKVYICTFLAQVKAELGQHQQARMYCLQGLGSLKKHHPEYRQDKSYLELLSRNLGGL